MIAHKTNLKVSHRQVKSVPIIKVPPPHHKKMSPHKSRPTVNLLHHLPWFCRLDDLVRSLSRFRKVMVLFKLTSRRVTFSFCINLTSSKHQTDWFAQTSNSAVSRFKSSWSPSFEDSDLSRILVVDDDDDEEEEESEFLRIGTVRAAPCTMSPWIKVIRVTVTISTTTCRGGFDEELEVGEVGVVQKVTLAVELVVDEVAVVLNVTLAVSLDGNMVTLARWFSLGSGDILADSLIEPWLLTESSASPILVDKGDNGFCVLVRFPAMLDPNPSSPFSRDAPCSMLDVMLGNDSLGGCWWRRELPVWLLKRFHHYFLLLLSNWEKKPLSGGIGWLVVMQRAPGLAIASSLCLFPTLLSR